MEIFHEGKLFWKFSKKAKFCENSLKKASYCENFSPKQFFWKYSNKAIFGGHFSTKLHILWKFSDKLMIILMELCQQNIVKLGRSFVIKQRENWWKYPQNPSNCQNFCAAMLPCCKGFCDSAWHVIHDMRRITWTMPHFPANNASVPHGRRHSSQAATSHGRTTYQSTCDVPPLSHTLHIPCLYY